MWFGLQIQQLFSEDPHLASVKLAAIKKDMQVLSFIFFKLYQIIKSLPPCREVGQSNLDNMTPVPIPCHPGQWSDEKMGYLCDAQKAGVWMLTSSVCSCPSCSGLHRSLDIRWI